MKNKFVQEGFDELGREIPDPTPVEVPLAFREPPSLVEEIRRFVRQEMSAQAESAGQESFEEADDFDVSDEELPVSEHELSEDQEMRRIAVRSRDRVDNGDDDGPESGETGGAGSVVGQREDDGVAGVAGVGESDQAESGTGDRRGSEGHFHGEAKVDRRAGKKVSVNSEAAELVKERPSRRK